MKPQDKMDALKAIHGAAIKAHMKDKRKNGEEDDLKDEIAGVKPLLSISLVAGKKKSA